MKAEREKLARGRGVAGEAMDDAAARRHSDFAHDRDHARFGVAAMNHDRTIHFGGEFEMAAQRRFLRLDRRMHVVEIETALANRDDSRRCGEVAQLRDAIVVAILGVMRMDADRGIDVGVAFGDRDGLAIAFDRADRADRDHRAQAGVARAFEDRVGIAAQLGSARWQWVSVRFKWVRSDISQRGVIEADSGGREFFAAREQGGGRVHFVARLEACAVGCATARRHLTLSIAKIFAAVTGMNGSSASATTRMASIRLARICATCGRFAGLWRD